MANQGEDESGRAQSTVWALRPGTHKLTNISLITQNDLIDTASDEIRTICNQSGSGSKVYEQGTARQVRLYEELTLIVFQTRQDMRRASAIT